MGMSECINPAEVRDGDLLAYAAGRADAAVRSHVQRCPHCAEQAASYAQIDLWLGTELYRSGCPAPEALARWQLGLLRADEALQVAAHARACPHCTRELEELAAVNDDLLSSLLDVLRGIGRWVEAALVPPAARLAARQDAPGVSRGPAFALPRRYRAGDLEILVGAQKTSGGWQLRGRLRPPAGQRSQVGGIEVWLVQEGQPLAHCLSDERGHFRFQPVLPGQYGLGLAWQGQAVLIREVEV
jgi:anti-sigma factor RsiW